MSKKFIYVGLLAVMLLGSCASRKDFVYLNDMEMGVKYPIDTKYEAIVHRDDRLAISVTCKNMELAIPFNIQGGNFRVNSDGGINSAEGAVNEKGYRVDSDGNIDFPILGQLHVEGLKVSELKKLIETRIKDGNYIKDPSVSIDFLNFKYTVLGAVGRNGSFSVNGDRITLLEAIANAGDVTNRGRMDRVMVIREVGGERQIFAHDLRSKDLFESPCFYLQQNDIVYVEPKYRKKDAEDRGWQIFTTVTSLASLVISLFWVLK